MMCVYVGWMDGWLDGKVFDRGEGAGQLCQPPETIFLSRLAPILSSLPSPLASITPFSRAHRSPWRHRKVGSRIVLPLMTAMGMSFLDSLGVAVLGRTKRMEAPELEAGVAVVAVAVALAVAMAVAAVMVVTVVAMVVVVGVVVVVVVVASVVASVVALAVAVAEEGLAMGGSTECQVQGRQERSHKPCQP